MSNKEEQVSINTVAAEASGGIGKRALVEDLITATEAAEPDDRLIFGKVGSGKGYTPKLPR